MKGHSAPDTLQELCAAVFERIECDCVLATETSATCTTVLAGHGRAFTDAIGQRLNRETAICHHTVDLPNVLAIDNSFTHPLVMYTKVVSKLGVGSYIGAGVDLEGDNRRCICALGRKPRVWTIGDRGVIQRAAAYARETLTRTRVSMG